MTPELDGIMNVVDWIITGALGAGGLGGLYALRARIPSALRAAGNIMVNGEPPSSNTPSLAERAPRILPAWMDPVESTDVHDAIDLIKSFTAVPAWQHGDIKALVAPNAHVITANPALQRALGAAEWQLAVVPFDSYSIGDEALDYDKDMIGRLIKREIDRYGVDRRKYRHFVTGETVMLRLVVTILPRVTWRGAGPVIYVEGSNITDLLGSEETIERMEEENAALRRALADVGIHAEDLVRRAGEVSGEIAKVNPA